MKRLKIKKLSIKFLLNLMVFFLIFHVISSTVVCVDLTKQSTHVGTATKKLRKKRSGHAAKEFLSGALEDVLDLHKELFTWDSLKVAASVFPFYVGSRIVDEPFQNYFYDPTHHKNINTLPNWWYMVTRWGIAAPIAFLGLQAFFGKTEEMRQTSRVFLLGLPFVIWAKMLIKRPRFEANLRPWHEDFSCEERASGGFPSGHMEEGIYTALLYGMRFGPSYAIPLGAVATVVGATFLVCNRHYLSQLIAGAGFGAVYALAANKVVDSRLMQDLELDLIPNIDGGLSLSVAYRF